MKALTLIVSVILTTSAFAKTRVLFHPYDPTLKTIATVIEEATESVDIAVYNIGATTRNPIIKTIASPKIQKRIANQSLKIRLIFEGFETKEKNKEKMAKLEAFGIDVRYLGSGKKMHHKFAVIDGNTNHPQLITGSANWSVASRRNFNENIFFFENEPGISNAFQKEFHLLWKTSKEFGERRFSDHRVDLENVDLEKGLDIFFNTDNFKVKNGKISKDSSKDGYILTRKIAEAIDQATDRVQIATTRLKLRPIYEAIVRAAARGVKIDIVVTMGEYEYPGKRKKMKLQDCADEFNKKCSTSQNFVVYLDRKDYEGHKNVNVRIKWFHVKKAVYLNKQMHSKYIVIDGKRVLSGSFNWSYSSEYNHIENLVDVRRGAYPKLVEQFDFDFERLWTKNRDTFKPFVKGLEDALESSTKTACGFAPMTLTIKEIDYMLASGRRMGKSLKKVCK